MARIGVVFSSGFSGFFAHAGFPADLIKPDKIIVHFIALGDMGGSEEDSSIRMMKSWQYTDWR